MRHETSFHSHAECLLTGVEGNVFRIQVPITFHGEDLDIVQHAWGEVGKRHIQGGRVIWDSRVIWQILESPIDFHPIVGNVSRSSHPAHMWTVQGHIRDCRLPIEAVCQWMNILERWWSWQKSIKGYCENNANRSDKLMKRLLIGHFSRILTINKCGSINSRGAMVHENYILACTSVLKSVWYVFGTVGVKETKLKLLLFFCYIVVNWAKYDCLS